MITMKKMRKALAILLCMMMCFSILQPWALAENVPPEAAGVETVAELTEDTLQQETQEALEPEETESGAEETEPVGEEQDKEGSPDSEEEIPGENPTDEITEPTDDPTSQSESEKAEEEALGGESVGGTETSEEVRQPLPEGTGQDAPENTPGDIAAEPEVEENAALLQDAAEEEDEVAELMAASGSCGENVTWEMDEGVLVLSGTGAMTNYSYSGSPFYAQRSIQSVVISPGVTSIGSYAFNKCINITEVSIAQSVEGIGNNAFYGCEGLENITIPDGVKRIGDNAFNNCTALKSAEIPESVTTIGKAAFQSCSALEEIVLPGNITEIGESVFLFCSSLESASFSDGVTSVGYRMFYRCENLTTVTLGAGIQSIGNEAFYSCGSLTAVSMPKNVTSIGFAAFRGCSALSSITIPEGVTKIDYYTFADCSGLESVSIPESVTEIGYYAFENCSSIQNVYYGGDEGTRNRLFPNLLTGAVWHYGKQLEPGWDYCGDSAIWNYDAETRTLTIKGSGDIWDYEDYYDSSWNHVSDAPWSSLSSRLKTVRVETGISRIGDYAFYNFVAITALQLPETLQSIGKEAFAGCEGLKSVKLPDSVETLGYNCFGGCRGMEELELGGRISDFGTYAFDSCESLRQIVFSEGITNIGAYTFHYCYSLEDLVLPNSLLTIGEHAFKNCRGLKSIILGDSVTTIGSFAFESCWDLTEIVIPDSVVTIETCAFQWCESLRKVVIGKGTATIEGDAFSFGDVSEVVFQGDYPNLDEDAFHGVTADVYYPEDRDWREDDLRDYGGKLTWHPYSQNLRDFRLSETHLDLVCGEKAQLSIDKSGIVSWTSADSTVALVNSDGIVTANKIGETVITASSIDGTYSTSCSVKTLFTDVDDSDSYYYTPVYWALENGVTAGTSPTTFSPNNTCTRGQIVTFLWKALGSPEPSSANNPFTDVKESDYFYQPVLWAKERGVTSGKTPTTFEPMAPCTRGQIMTFLWIALGRPEPASENNPFTDVSAGDYFYKPVLWAVEKGITAGTSATTFSPGKACTRAQAMTFLYKAMA